MGSPSTSLATLRPDLSGSFMEFGLEMDRQGFIGHRVLPVMDVAVQSNVFGKIKLKQLLENRETARAPGAGYSRSKWQFETDSFATGEHGAEEPVDDREANIYANYFDAEQISASRALDVVVRNAEKRIAAAIFNATTWTGASLTTAIVNEWDDASNATPITDVNAAVKKVWEGCGLWPNALIINRRVFRNLREVTQIIDRIKYAGFMNPVASEITTAALAQVFDLDFILVAGSAKNNANEGQAASIAPIWSDEYAMVARIATTNDIQEPCLGRIFHYAGDGSSVDGRMESYRDETVRGDMIRCRHEVAEKVLYVQCGHLLSNVTT